MAAMQGVRRERSAAAAEMMRRMQAVEGEVARLVRRLESMAGELRATQRRAAAAQVSPVEVVRRAEAASLLDMKPATLAAWARDGHGPAYHLRGNRAWYRVADLAAWKQAAENDASPGPRRPAEDGSPRLPGV